jgi:hypothetical protein
MNAPACPESGTELSVAGRAKVIPALLSNLKNYAIPQSTTQSVRCPQRTSTSQSHPRWQAAKAPYHGQHGQSRKEYDQLLKQTSHSRQNKVSTSVDDAGKPLTGGK